MITQAYNMLDSRKTTSFERLDKKVEEYINLAKGIVNDEMDDEKRYNALAGLYKHIDSENGGYVDMLKEEPDDKVDNYIRKQNIDTESQAPRTGNSLSKLFDYLKKKESEITLRSTVNGVEHYAFGMNWLPQDGVIPAQVLLFILMEMICYDGEYYWLQVKIRTGKELPKFWEKKSFREELDEIIKQQGIEAEERNRQFVKEIKIQAAEVIQRNQGFFPIPITKVAPDGRLIVEYPTDNQENQRNKHMIAKGRPTPETIETGNEQYLYSKLYRYAQKIKDRLIMINEMQGLEKRETKYISLNWVLNLILNDDNAEYLRVIRNLPPEEEQYLWDACCFDDDELASLGSFVDMILKEKERSLEDEYYDSWLKHKVDGHYKSAMVLSVLVAKLRHELEETYSLLESANHRPAEPIATLSVAAEKTELSSSKKGRKKVTFPHFNLELPNDFDFETSLERMTTGKYLDKKTTAVEWKYACTGEGEEPACKLNWVGKVNELAKMADLFNSEKKVIRGQYATAAKIFTIDGEDTNRNNLKSAAKEGIWEQDEKKLKKALLGLISTQS